MTEETLRRLIWKACWETNGRAPSEADYSYWIGKWPELEARGKELNNPNYATQRLYGMGAGGADIPKYGPYAVPPSAVNDAPPYPGDVPPPPPDPVPDPGTPDPDLGLIGELVTRLDKIEASLVSIAAGQVITNGQLAQGFTNRYIGAITPRGK